MEWIDLIVSRLPENQRTQNSMYTAEKLRTKRLKEHLPRFMQSLGHAVERIATELDEKLGATLGGVTSGSSDNGFHVRTKKMSVEGAINRDAGTALEVTTLTHHPSFGPTGTQKFTRYSLIPTDDAIEAILQPNAKKKYTDAARLASDILSEAFSEGVIAR